MCGGRQLAARRFASSTMRTTIAERCPKGRDDRLERRYVLISPAGPQLGEPTLVPLQRCAMGAGWKGLTHVIVFKLHTMF